MILILDKIPHITIPKPDGSPYLTRYYLMGEDKEWGNAFLHHFHSSDMDVAPLELGGSGTYLLHNHPVNFAFSFVLSGGYVEERRNVDDTISTKIVKPRTFNWLTGRDFHRVQLLDEEKGAWTLFFTGSRKSREWGFWDRETRQYIHYRKFAKAVA